MDNTKNITNNSNNSTEQENIIKELKELRAQFISLEKELHSIKENDSKITKLKENIEVMQNEFKVMNKNLHEISQMSASIKELNEKINMLAEDSKCKRERQEMGSIFRRAAVKTVGSFLTVSDIAIEKASLAKEGIEDIVAEAQYENTKKRRHRYAHNEE